MRRFFLPCFVTCTLCVLAMLTQATAETDATSSLMLPTSVTFTAGDGVEVVVRGVDLIAKQLRVEIRGLNVTGLPKGFPVVLRFDTNIVHMTPVGTSAGLVVDATSTSRVAIWFFTRDPFMPPAAWHHTVLIELDELPSTGQIAAGPHEVRHVTYRAVPTPSPTSHPASKPSL